MTESRLAQLGRRPIPVLGAGFAAIVCFTELLGQAGTGELLVAGVVQILAFIVLVAVVAWHRDDDLLEAGVLLALITGVAVVASRLFTSILETGSLSGILMIPGMMLGLLLRAVVGGAVGALIIWILRRFRQPARSPSA